MFNVSPDLWDLYYDEEYQRLTHLCNSELKNSENESIKKMLLGILHYAQACDSWEKSYNFQEILSDLSISIEILQILSTDLEGDKREFVLGLKTMSEINSIGVQIENCMIFNDASGMRKYSVKGVEICNKFLENVSESDYLEDIIDLITSYRNYVKSYGEYALVFEKYRNKTDFEDIYIEVNTNLTNTIQEMIENDDRITSSEISALKANLDKSVKFWRSDEPSINIKNSSHHLSISFYVSSPLANHLINDISPLVEKEISEKIFNGKFKIKSAGVDSLDDFLQTSIGEEYGDMFHLILQTGQINIFGSDLDFETHIYIRRFGTCSINFELEIENITPSDFRMIQTLVGPQVGITDINWNGKKYQKLDNICKEIYDEILKYHDVWIVEDDLLDVLHMDSAPYDPDRTWFSRSVILEAHLMNNSGDVVSKVLNYEELHKSFEFKAITSELVEGRPSLDDWIQLSDKKLANLAKIRLHSEDLILFDTHNLVVFLPSKPDFILKGVLSTASLVNDISTLINGFDVMAERVRSNLIIQVKHAKHMLEQVEIDTIKSDLKILRRNVIEVTEFELLALQSIQLLKSQSTIKYQDHAKFLLELIDRSTISTTIESLEQKIGIIKESQEGILRTADDLVAKYQEEVSESQQRLVRVITLIGAGVAQITIIDDILAVFQNQGWINTSSSETIKLFVIILAFIFSGIAISWLGFGYLRSKKNLFE